MRKIIFLLVLLISYHPVSACLVGSITGGTSVAIGSTISLTDTSTAGVWSSGSPAIASVSAAGIVTGLSAGIAVISYTNACGTAVDTVHVYALSCSTAIYTNNGCPYSLWIFSVSIPAGASGTSLSDLAMPCTSPTYYVDHTLLSPVKMTADSAYTVTITSGTTFPNYADAWIDFNDDGTFATSELVVSGVSIMGIGTASIVIPAAAPGGTHRMRFRSNYSSPLSPASGCTVGMYGSTVDYLVDIGSGSGLSSISGITGPSVLCVGANITLSDATPGGTWSSSNVGIATVGSTGVVTGISPGVDTINYVTSGGSTTYIITVNPVPVAISGTLDMCLAGSGDLSDATPGGTWSSSNTSVAAFIGSPGFIVALATGTTNITYVLPTGCFATSVMTVDPSPAPITGTTVFCNGTTTILSDTSVGGTWTSGSIAVGTIDPVTGALDGLSVGSVIVTYTLSDGCFRTSTINVISCTLGTSETVLLQDNIEVLPNPATDELTIKMTANAYSSFTITNSIGQQIMHRPIIAKQTTVSVGILPAGLFYITFRGDNGAEVRKFVKS